MQGSKNLSLKNSKKKLKPLISTEFDLSSLNKNESKYQRIPKTAVHSPRPREF